MADLTHIYPARFMYWFVENLPEKEGVEMIFKYAQNYQIPITDEVAYLFI